MISSKGFLFTISVIIFASTLVVFAQVYTNSNLGAETRILTSYKPTSEFFLNESIANDLSSLFGVDTSVDILDGRIKVNISDSLSKDYSVSGELASYDSFLTDSFFPQMAGSQDINLDGLSDGGYELFFGNEFTYSNNYDSELMSFVSSNTLNSLDLNIVHQASNLVDSVWTPVDGSVEFNLFFTNDTNSVIVSDQISPTSASELLLIYADYNILVTVGSNNSFYIDSDSSDYLEFVVKANYDFDQNYLPVVYNAIINYSLTNFDSNSHPKIIG
ncbi:MAG: hypothetical protein WC915_00235 [archaeon]|jgi:hypothetical protein